MKYEKPYVQFEVGGRKEFSIRTSLSAITEHMPLPLFLCNRSTIVNLMHVNWIGESTVKLRDCRVGELSFEISREKRNELREKYHLVKTVYFRCHHCVDCEYRSACIPPCHCVVSNNLIFSNQELIVTEAHEIFSILYREILSFTIDTPYVRITNIDKEEKLIRASLSEIIQYLPYSFFQCNQSTIVNLQHVASYEKTGRNCLIHSIIGNDFSVSVKNIKSFHNQCRHIREVIIPNPSCLSCRRHAPFNPF